MTTEAIGAMAPGASSPVMLESHDDADGDSLRCEGPKPTGLHSPPESNNATVLDGSDSELSDLEDAIADQLRDEVLSHAVPATAPEPAPAEAEDIGEILLITTRAQSCLQAYYEAVQGF